LVDFGETIHLCIDDIFNIKGEDIKNKVFSFPTLAFQCKIAKICAPKNRQLKDYWSEEIKVDVGDKLSKVKGTVSMIINYNNS